MSGIGKIDKLNNPFANPNLQALSGVKPIKSNGGQNAGAAKGLVTGHAGTISDRMAALDTTKTPNYGSEGMNVNGGVAGKRLNLFS